MPTQLKNPIAVRLNPASVNHADKVEKTSKKGKPAEKPRNSITTTCGLV